MLILASTDIVRVVTSAAASVTVNASWADLDNTTSPPTITPSRSNTAAITTATTTTIVSSPSSPKLRNVRTIMATNNSATVSTQITVQMFDGTTFSDLMGVTMLPGENLILDETGSWHHHDVQGAEYIYSGPPVANLGLTSTIAETMPRELCPEVNSTVPTASGTLFLQAIYLKAGQTVSNITASSATTAAGTPTNYFLALYSGLQSAPALLAQSANQTTTAWAANTTKTLAMTTPYKVPTSGVYYIGVMMVATTVMTMKGGTARTGGTLAGGAPIISGTSTTGLTTTLPNPAAALTSSTASFYAAVS